MTDHTQPDAAEVEALEMLLLLVEHETDLPRCARNGVTDATDTVDDGEVRAAEILERARAALAAAPAAAGEWAWIAGMPFQIERRADGWHIVQAGDTAHPAPPPAGPAVTLPTAHNGCQCACHRMSGIVHVVACCAPTALERGEGDRP